MRLLAIFTVGLLPFSTLDRVESEYLNLDPKPLSVVNKSAEIDCLARNIYHEARGESLRGQIAVAAVTVNRVLTKGYPASICQVVYQPYQFSWVKELLKSKHNPRENEQFRTARAIASAYLKGLYKDPTKGALFYHASRVNPKWAKTVLKTAQIGNHVFYAKA